MTSKLTEKQQQWLDLFFGEAKGDAKLATELSDYAEGTAPAVIVGALQDEISERTRDIITTSGYKAFAKMIGLLDKPTELGASTIIAAAKDILDRGGFGKTDKVEVKTDNPIFILPPKEHG